MKKFLLAVAAAAAVFASAAERPARMPARLPGVPVDQTPVYNPAGEEELYIMNVTEVSGWGIDDCVGYKLYVRWADDRSTIWFRDLASGFGRYTADEEYTWIKGTVSGNDISVAAGQVIYRNDEYGQLLNLEAVTVNEAGEVDKFLPELHFTIQGDRIVSADDEVYLGVYEDGPTMDEAGFYIFAHQYSMEPVGEIPAFTPPASAEVQSLLMTYDGGARMVNVARADSTVYIAGLSTMAPLDYVPATVQGDQLFVKGGYILTSNERYFVRLMAAREGEPDEWGYPTMDLLTAYTFDISGDGNTFTLNPASDFIVDVNYELSGMFDGITGVKIFPYAGDVPATPAAPSLMSYNEYDNLMRITVPCEDVDGNYINPEKLAYRFYLDGELYTFSPADYVYLTEDMVDIPYNFTDNYDIYSSGTLKTIYFQTRFTSLEVESVYTVDGDTRSSGKVALTAGVQDPVTADLIDESYTDMLGRQVFDPRPGSLLIVTSRYADGSVVRTKRLVK